MQACMHVFKFYVHNMYICSMYVCINCIYIYDCIMCVFTYIMSEYMYDACSVCEYACVCVCIYVCMALRMSQERLTEK